MKAAFHRSGRGTSRPWKRSPCPTEAGAPLFGDMTMISVIGVLLSFFILLTSKSAPDMKRSQEYRAAVRAALPTMQFRSRPAAKQFPAAQHLLNDLPGTRIEVDQFDQTLAIIPLELIFPSGSELPSSNARVIVQRLQDFTTTDVGEIILLPASEQDALLQIPQLLEYGQILEQQNIAPGAHWRVMVASSYSAKHPLILFRTLRRRDSPTQSTAAFPESANGN